MSNHHTLSLLPHEMAVCRLGPREPFPDWAASGEFFSITRTADELSVVCEARLAPPGVRQEGGWRALKVHGPFDFSAIGVLASLAAPLAEARISILAISTFDTDYLLVKSDRLEAALRTLAGRGHEIRI